MHSLSKKLLAASVLAAVGGTAMAADKSPITGNVALTSNYIWRGFSQTAEQMAIQGGFDYAHDSGLYVGTWGSNVNFGQLEDPGVTDLDERAQLELDVYAGYKFKAGIDWDVGVLYYAYPGSASAADYDWYEFYAGGTWKWLNVKYSYSTDYTGSLSDESASYLEANLNFDVGQGVTLGLHVGNSSGDGVKETWTESYMDYKVSLAKEFGGLNFTVGYTDTDFDTQIEDGAFRNDGQFFLTVAKSL